MKDPYVDYILKYYKGHKSEDGDIILPDQYYSSINKRRSKQSVWQEILKEIKNIEGVVKIRDFSNSCHQYAFKLAIGFKGVDEGITICIGFLPNIIGYYFFNYNKITYTPIEHYNRSYPHFSYFPFDNNQLKYCLLFLEIINKHLKDFQLFNNLIASENFDEVMIDGSVFNHMDYYQILFDTVIDGIL